MIRFRVYEVNSETGERTELGVDEYEPAGYIDSHAVGLPPCCCPKCVPRPALGASAPRAAIEAAAS